MTAVRIGVMLLLFSVSGAFATPLSGGNTLPKVAPTSPAHALFRKGVQALLARDFTAAETDFLASAKADPKLPDPLLGLADLAVKARKPAVAQQWLNKALAVAPNSDEVYVALARLQRGNEDLQSAVRSFRKALSINRRAFPALLELGEIYMQTLQPAKAVPLFRDAVALRPGDALAHYSLGVALTTTGKNAEAISELEKAHHLAPQDVSAPRALARLYTEGKRYKDSLAVLERAISLAPNEIALALDHADTLAASGDVPRAEREYRTLLNRDSTLAVAHVRLGEIRVSASDPNGAVTEFTAALDTQPDNVDALNNLAWLDATARRSLDVALTRAKRAVALAPTMANVRDTLGWVYLARGHLEAARDEFVRAVQLSPTAAAPVYHLGIVLGEQGKRDEARAALRRSLAMKPPLAAEEAADARQRLAKLGAH